MHETAWAKLNLALHVRARRADGYHEIESLFAFAEDGDVLSAAPAEALTLQVTGPFAGALAAEPDNLVLRAARALRDLTGMRRGAALTLDKRLPVASGIGGGSADAAAALRLLVRLWGVPVGEADLLSLAARLGADVPACLIGQTLRGAGRGDELAPAAAGGLSGTPVLLVNPGVPLSTASVFAAWDGIDRGALGDGEPIAVALDGRNDLEPPATALVPEIGALLGDLRMLDGVRLARMSGSGATCFALFEDATARAEGAAHIRDVQPGYWYLESMLR